MKILLLILLLTSSAFARTHYITSSNTLNELETLQLHKYSGDTISFKGGDTIRGAASFSFNWDDTTKKIVFNSYGTGKAVLKTQGTTNYIFWFYFSTKVLKVEFNNLIFIGNYDPINQTGGVSDSKGIWVHHYFAYNDTSNGKGMYININNCEFTKFQHSGIHIDIASYFKRGTYLITNNKFYGLGKQAISINGIVYSNFVISGNTFYNIYSTSKDMYNGFAIGISRCRGFVIEKNIIDGCGIYAKIGSAGIYVGFSKSGIIRGNIISHVYYISNEGVGVYASDCGSDSMVVDNNNISYCYAGIMLANASSTGFCGNYAPKGFNEDSLEASYNVASFNTITNCVIGIWTYAGYPNYDGTYNTTYQKNNRIEWNNITVNGGYGVYQYGRSDGLRVYQNKFYVDANSKAFRRDLRVGFTPNWRVSYNFVNGKIGVLFK